MKIEHGKTKFIRCKEPVLIKILSTGQARDAMKWQKRSKPLQPSTSTSSPSTGQPEAGTSTSRCANTSRPGCEVGFAEL